MRMALLSLMLTLAGCVTRQLLSGTPKTVETLDGNYRVLASCTYEHLNRQQDGLRRTDGPELGVVRIALDSEWEMSFINEGEAGRRTRLEVTWMGSQVSEHALANVRACAA